MQTLEYQCREIEEGIYLISLYNGSAKLAGVAQLAVTQNVKFGWK